MPILLSQMEAKVAAGGTVELLDLNIFEQFAWLIPEALKEDVGRFREEAIKKLPPPTLMRVDDEPSTPAARVTKAKDTTRKGERKRQRDEALDALFV